MSTYAKSAMPERADSTSVADSSDPVGCYVQKKDIATEAPAGGAEGSYCTFHLGDPALVDDGVETNYIVVQTPSRYIICNPCADAIGAALAEAAE